MALAHERPRGWVPSRRVEREEFSMHVEWKISQQIGAGIVHEVVSPAFLIRGVLPKKMIRRGDGMEQ